MMVMISIMLPFRSSSRGANNSGFALPTVLIASIVMLIVLLSAVSAASGIRSALDEQYYTKLAQEAAEAGQARADACLEANNYTAAWSDAARLRPDTTCAGVAISEASSYIAQSGTIRTTFSVWAPVTSSTGNVMVTVVGTTELIRSSNGTVRQSYTHTLVRQSGNEANFSTDSSSGFEETCGIVTQKTYCWGGGGDGRLGNGTTTTSLTPVEVSREPGVLSGRIDTDVSVGVKTACNISSGRAYCWGSNAAGKLGNNSTTNSSVPVAVATSTGMSEQVAQIAAGNKHTCALTISGDVYCWGSNASGQLGIGLISPESLTPVRVTGVGAYAGRPVTKLVTTAYSDSTCVITTTSAGPRAYCWGANQDGQLGDGTTTARTSAIAVSTAGVLSGKNVTDISISAATNTGAPAHACAVASGLAYCWGAGTEGALGHNSTSNSLVPVAVYTAGVLSAKTVLEINVGFAHACVTAKDASGNVAPYCWGRGTAGQLGNGGASNSSVPVAVSVLAGGLQGRVVGVLKGGGNRGCVIADSTTYCWGMNFIGQLGDGTTTDRAVPTAAIFLSQKIPVVSY